MPISIPAGRLLTMRAASIQPPTNAAITNSAAAITPERAGTLIQTARRPAQRENETA